MLDPIICWHEMLDLRCRLAQCLIADEWAVNVTTVRPILLKYECNLSKRTEHSVR